MALSCVLCGLKMTVNSAWSNDGQSLAAFDRPESIALPVCIYDWHNTNTNVMSCLPSVQSLPNFLYILGFIGP